MQVLIKETKETHTLTLRRPKTGVDYIKDFIGNASGFINNDFVRFNELSKKEQREFADFGDDYYYTTQSDFMRWQPVIEDTAKADIILENFSEILTEDILKELDMACDSDIEATATARLNILTRATGQVNLIREEDVDNVCRINGDKLTAFVTAYFDITDDDDCEVTTFDAMLHAVYKLDEDGEVVLPAIEQQLTHLENLTEEQEAFVLKTLQGFAQQNSVESYANNAIIGIIERNRKASKAKNA